MWNKYDKKFRQWTEWKGFTGLYIMVAIFERWRELLRKHLAAIIVLLFAVQPLMDICSFWLDKLGMSTAPTLLLRMLVFALTALIGFCLSDKKRYYWALAAICAVFFVCHAVSCARAGYISPFADLTNYIRVIQIPIFALCLITQLSLGWCWFCGVLCHYHCRSYT